MKIAIIGIGAMGSLFAARLSTVAEVVMVGSWPEQLAALQKGLDLIHADGSIVKCKIRTATRMEDIGTVDWVLVLVKSYQTTKVAKKIGQLGTIKDGLRGCLTLQNGVGNLEKLSTVLGPELTFAGTTTQAAKIVSPGVVQDTGPGNISLEKSTQHDLKIAPLSKVFFDAGFEVIHVEDIRSLIWGKLVINAGINPLTAILNLPNGAIAQHEIYRKIMFRLAEEAAEVAMVQGIALPYRNVRARVMKVAQSTANNSSSMLRDVLRHSQTEIDAICGEVIEKGAVYGIKTPVNNIIFDIIKAIEAGKQNSNPHAELSEIVRSIT